MEQFQRPDEFNWSYNIYEGDTVSRDLECKTRNELWLSIFHLVNVNWFIRTEKSLNNEKTNNESLFFLLFQVQQKPNLKMPSPIGIYFLIKKPQLLVCKTCFDMSSSVVNAILTVVHLNLYEASISVDVLLLFYVFLKRYRMHRLNWLFGEKMFKQLLQFYGWKRSQTGLQYPVSFNRTTWRDRRHCVIHVTLW